MKKKIFLNLLFTSFFNGNLLCMIQESKVNELQLQAQEKLKKFLVAKDGKPIDPFSNDYPIALGKFADTIVQHIKVLQEIKQKGQIKEKKGEEKRVIQQQPFTQTLAYLNPEHKKNFDYDREIVRISKLFMRKDDPEDKKNYLIQEPNEYEKQLFKNIIINEQKHSDYYVFYQGAAGFKDQNAGPGLLTDVYTEIARWFDINQYSKSMMLRVFELKEPYSSVENFLTKTKKSAISNEGFDVYAGDFLLATNISLFGRMTENNKANYLVRNDKGKWYYDFGGDEFTLSYFFRNYSCTFDANDIIKTTFGYFGFDSSYIKDIFNNYKKHMENAGGHLLQIFVDKKIVDEVAYLSIWQGRPLRDKLRWDNLKDKYSIKQYFGLEGSFDPLFKKIGEGNLENISVFLDKYINDPDFINYYSKSYITYTNYNLLKDTKNVLGLLPWFDTIQARLLMIPKFFSDESKMTVFRYYSEKQIDEYSYKKDLSKIFEKIIKDWIISQLKAESAKSSKSSNLTKLLDFLITNPVVEEKKNKISPLF